MGHLLVKVALWDAALVIAMILALRLAAWWLGRK
jgi:hypothetical protein